MRTQIYHGKKKASLSYAFNYKNMEEKSGKRSGSESEESSDYTESDASDDSSNESSFETDDSDIEENSEMQGSDAPSMFEKILGQAVIAPRPRSMVSPRVRAKRTRTRVNKRIDNLTVALAVSAIISFILNIFIVEYPFFNGFSPKKSTEDPYCAGSPRNDGTLVFFCSDKTGETILKSLSIVITLIILILLFMRSHYQRINKYPLIISKWWQLQSKMFFTLEVILNCLFALPTFHSMMGLVSFLRLYHVVRLLRFQKKVKRTRLLQINSSLVPDQGVWVAIKTVLVDQPWASLMFLAICLIPLFSYVMFVVDRWWNYTLNPEEEKEYTFSTNVYQVATLFSIVEPIDSDVPYIRVPSLVSGLLAVMVATILFTSLEQSLTLTKNEESAMNSTLVARSEEELRDHAARIIWYTWFEKRAKKKRKDKANVYGKKSSIMRRRTVHKKLIEIKKKKLAAWVSFRKCKKNLKDLYATMEKALGEYPAAVLTEKQAISTHASITELKAQLETQSSKICSMQDQIKIKNREYQNIHWQDKMARVLSYEDHILKEQQRIESNFLTTLDNVNSKLNDNQEQLVSVMTTFQEEEKNNMLCLQEKLKEMLQLHLQTFELEKKEVTQKLELVRTNVEQKIEHHKASKVTIKESNALLQELKKNADISSIQDMVEDDKKDIWNIEENNMAENKRGKNTLFDQTQQEQRISRKQIRMIIANIESLKDVALKSTEMNIKEKKILLKQAKEKDNIDKKEHQTILANIESVKTNL